ncbi:MAG: chitinase [Gammaproteobacteria bacterium]|nr:chitinase [Gammaproteobacteria bacterium]
MQKRNSIIITAFTFIFVVIAIFTQNSYAAQILEPTQKIFAPYVDVMLWPTFSLEKTYIKTGQKYYTLAFITAGQDGQPAWGGIIPIVPDPQYSGYFYANEIKYIRDIGGDVIISFGGAFGTPIDATIKDVNKLVEAYETVIKAYQLTRIDFDVEGGFIADRDSIDRRNAALKILEQRHPELKVAYCLPAMPYGLTEDGKYVLESAIKAGVRVDIVNIMAMDFGSSYVDMKKEIIASANSTFLQLKELYPNKLDSDLWAMLGITPMIGQNDVQTEVVWLDDARAIEAFAVEKGVGLMAMWSAGRDNGDKIDIYASPSHSGIVQKDFEFISIFQRYLGPG